MPTLTDLRNAIDQLLAHPLGPGNFVLVRHIEEKAYEAYVFCLCMRAARELGASVELRGITGPPNPFIFRGGPGAIYSTARNYGYGYFRLNGHEFEVHTSVEFTGNSDASHELDVSIIRHPDANACRIAPKHNPNGSALIAGWECKFYDDTLDTVLGRAFVGLLDDLGTNVRESGLASNVASQSLRDYLEPQRRPYPHFHLSPLNSAEETRFVERLKSELAKYCRC